MDINLTESEDIVLEVVQEYLSNNNSFDFYDILPYISSRLRAKSINLNKNGVRKTLKSLVRKNVIVKGSTLTVRDVLSLPKRRMIYNHIMDNPGIFFNKILEDLEYSYNVVIWHLNILRKFDFIAKTNINHHDVYYDSALTVDDIILGYYRNNNKSKLILEYLEKNDIGVTKTQLSKDLGLHINTVGKYLESLEQENIIVKEKYSNRTMYFLNFNKIRS